MLVLLQEVIRISEWILLWNESKFMFVVVEIWSVCIKACLSYLLADSSVGDLFLHLTAV